MSNPTTPFSWQMPTATDLVTDLPADFEVFGQAVATSMADLLGGTSGQILAKNSNTDMDFVWIANDQGDITGITATSPLTGGGTSGAVTVGIQDGTTAQKGAVQLENSTASTSTTTAAVPASVKSAYDLANGAIPKSLIDAAGDLIVGTAADTAGRLAIGTANQVLKVNSGATALEWGSAAAASGLTLISTQTVSNVASITFDNVFTSTYTNYLVVFDDIFNETTSSADLYFQYRYAGPTTQTSHTYAMNGANSASSVITVGATAQSSALLSRNMGQSTYRLSGQIFVSGVGNASRLAMGRGQTADTWGEEILNYFFYATVARTYTGFIISTSTGNLNGTFTVYGLAKS